MFNDLKPGQEIPKWGDFVIVKPTGGPGLFAGVVRAVGAGDLFQNEVSLESYDHGLPCTINLSNCFETEDGRYMGVTDAGHSVVYSREVPNFRVKILSLQDYLKHLEGAKKEIKELTQTEDLAAACWVTREEYLAGVIENLGTFSGGYPHHHDLRPSFEKTGVYVLSGRTNLEWDRCRINPSHTQLEGITVSPRVHPIHASGLVTSWYGPNFKSVRGVDDASGHAYFCYEVPERAVDFVKDPAKFTGPARGA